MSENRQFLEKAAQLQPEFYETSVFPRQLIEVIPDRGAYQGWKTNPVGNIETLKEKTFGRNEAMILDFGDHQVAHLHLSIIPVGSPPDAPLRLKLIFGEMPCEIGESFDEYRGWLSRSWLQEEIINIDILPAEIKLPRRYSFRYLKVIVIDTSIRYKVSFPDIHCVSLTTGNAAAIEPLPGRLPDDLKVIDRIAMKTLRDCMHSVFEDGPKRDRRLWIGDLRLQALTNYYTFKNYQLVKRCLYLLAGLTTEEGEVGACVFTEPHPLADDTILFDYALFFVASLYDYYIATRDLETLNELWPVAKRQLDIALKRIDASGIVRDDSSWWCFIDWHPDLNKQASAQAVLIYCLERGIHLARTLHLSEVADSFAVKIKELKDAALARLWNADTGFFTSGSAAQISWASQIWMILAGVLNQEQSALLLDRLYKNPPAVQIVTPYMYHHLIEALICCGKKDQALRLIRSYWGGMVKDGADCFWELYDPEDQFFSPYGSNLINSYCHAWSCTPSYFIRKYFAGD